MLKKISRKRMKKKRKMTMMMILLWSKRIIQITDSLERLLNVREIENITKKVLFFQYIART